jgi:hypothetical protein
MNPVGITPPLIALMNSNPSPGSRGSAAGLLLVAPVGLGRLADRLLIGNPRGLQVHLGAEPRLQPLDDHLDVDLGEPGDDLLAGLWIAVKVDRRVLLLEAPERREHLVLVALALGLDRERHHRRRELDAGHLDRLIARGQPVPRLGLLELGDGPDVAGTEVVGVPGPLSLEGHELADALLVVGARVQHLRVLLDHALIDAEHVDPPRERVRAGLEHVREHLLVLDRLERQLPDLQATVLDRRGKVLDDRVEQPIRAEVLGGDAAGHGEDRAVVGAVLERGDDLLVRDLLALKVALHQRV